MDKDRKEAKEKVKGYNLLEKINYYWSYYKFRFVFVMILVVLGCFTMYQQSVKVNADVDVYIFSYDYMGESTRESVRNSFLDWLKAKDDNDYAVDVTITTMSEDGSYNVDMAAAANSKLVAVFAAEQGTVYILDEKTYNKNISDGDFDYLALEKYSGEIGENAKKKLGLSGETKYYYITKNLRGNKANSEEEIRKQEYAKIIYEKIKEIK